MRSEPKIPAEKQVIHYEPVHAAEETGLAERPPAASEYLCDMCDKKFLSAPDLQEHRALHHKAPTGI